MGELDFDRVITENDAKTFHAEVPVLNPISVAVRAYNPLSLYDESDNLIGYANLAVNAIGMLVAQLIFDYATPERLDMQNNSDSYGVFLEYEDNKVICAKLVFMVIP